MSVPPRPRHRVWRNRPLATLALSQIAAALSFYVPVSALFLTSRGLSFTEIFWLESVLLASILATEVPAGVWADRIDRRWAIMAGYGFNAAAEVLFAVGQHFAMFALSFALSGIGLALLSGIEDAYVYESMGDGADEAAVGVFGHLSSLGIAAGVLAAVVGGGLATISIDLPAILSAVAAGLAAVIAWFLPACAPDPAVHGDPTPIRQVGGALRLIFRSPVLLYVSVAASAGFVLFNSVYTLNQPLFTAGAIPVSWWGSLVAAALLLAAVCNHFADLFEARLGRAGALFLATALGGIGFLLMSLPHPAATIAGFFLVIVGMNARGPVMGAIANKLVDSRRRSTVLSLMSTLGSLIGIAVNPVLGWGADISPTATSIGLGLVLLVLALTWLPVARKYLDNPSHANGTQDGATEAHHAPSGERLAGSPPAPTDSD